jgi:hypothetical protein
MTADRRIAFGDRRNINLVSAIIDVDALKSLCVEVLKPVTCYLAGTGAA